MGTYVDLKGGEGHLAFFQALDVQAKTAAEEIADNHIDVSFAAYDRSLWSPESAPTEVRIIARVMASAEYIKLNLSKANPHADRDKTVMSLSMQAAQMTADAVSRGYLTGTDGRRQDPEGDHAGINPRVVR